MSVKRVILAALLIAGAWVCAGCGRSVTPDRLVGHWTVVACSFEPMIRVEANDRFRGWVIFMADKTYEMEMHEKGRLLPTKRSGTFRVDGTTLQTVSGAKVTTSEISFQGNYLVTLTRQKMNQQNLYLYYLPAQAKVLPETKDGQ